MNRYKIKHVFASTDYSLDDICSTLDSITIDDEDSMMVILTFKAGETITLDLEEEE